MGQGPSSRGPLTARCGPEAQASASSAGVWNLFCNQFQIRALESQKRQQELVLRRKTQEVSEVPPQAGAGPGPSPSQQAQGVTRPEAGGQAACSLWSQTPGMSI